jgi:hypothetical protein
MAGRNESILEPIVGEESDALVGRHVASAYVLAFVKNTIVAARTMTWFI